MLIRLRDELYGGSWEDLRGDLERRKAGQPYLFKLKGRIEEDLQRLGKLQDYEEQNGINLSEYM